MNIIFLYQLRKKITQLPVFDLKLIFKYNVHQQHLNNNNIKNIIGYNNLANPYNIKYRSHNYTRIFSNNIHFVNACNNNFERFFRLIYNIHWQYYYNDYTFIYVNNAVLDDYINIFCRNWICLLLAIIINSHELITIRKGKEYNRLICFLGSSFIKQ